MGGIARGRASLPAFRFQIGGMLGAPLLMTEPNSQFGVVEPTVEQVDRRARPTKLFIGGLTRHTTTKMLRDHFSNYGCVLDCVAMRQPDGRPRGFGYVTLDSSAAAARCLAEPQIIDDRVVDMKRAVPEGSDNSPMGDLHQPAENLDPRLGAPMRVPFPIYNPWLDSRYSYCGANPLLGRIPASWAGHVANPLVIEQASMRVPLPGSTLTHGSSAVPDCLHLLGGNVSDNEVTSRELPFSPGFIQPEISSKQFASVPPALKLHADEPPTTTETCVSTGLQAHTLSKSRQPLGALSDITNIVNNQDASKRETKLIKGEKQEYAGTVRESIMSHDSKLSNPPSELYARPLGGNCGMLEIHEDSSDDGSAENVENLFIDHVSNEKNLSGSDQLPSIGSAQHAAGTCKRCNFFLKGRCQNGRDCAFCHFPHDKMKFSRQEKRDRRAVWQARLEVGGTASDEIGDEIGGSESESELEKITAYSVLPGLPPIRATALPEPLSLPCLLIANHWFFVTS